MTRSVLLVHGAGSGPWVFDGWPPCFPGIRVETVDLQHGQADPARLTMADYAEAIRRAARGLPRPLVVVAWSMGGLAAMMAADCADGLVLLEASAPAEIQGSHPDAALVAGAFDPEREYGAFPPGVRARPESALARAERKRGIAVPAIACSTLVVWGEAFPEDRGRRLAMHYGARQLHLAGKSHWDLVLDPEAIQAIARDVMAMPI